MSSTSGPESASTVGRPDAAHFLGLALLALEHLPESPVRNERAIDLAFDLRTALLPLGDLQRISERLTTAEALAKAIGDRRRLGMISVYPSSTPT